jgi:hypothetical protein
MKLFNSQKQQKAVLLNTLMLVEQIHSEIDNSSQKLLTVAKENYSNIQLNIKTLTKLGFVNSLNIQREKKLQSEMELYQTVIYYAREYPKMKFLTHEIFNNICKKYNLTKTVVENYTGEIPAEKLTEIYTNHKSIKNIDYDKNRIFIKMREQNWDEDKTVYVEITKKDFNNLERNILELIASDYNFRYPYLAVAGSTKKEVQISTLMIACDKSLVAKKQLSPNILVKNINPDPIVYFPVRGGLLILSKWGKEGLEKQLNY